MITFFTVPKPFKNPHIINIQRNAIHSWKALGNNIEIFLCGAEYGIKEIAKNYNVKHIPNIQTNAFNTPLLSSAFEHVKSQAAYPILCYVNCDIILLDNFLNLLRYATKFNEFLMLGRRIDINIITIITNEKKWQTKIKEKIEKEGIMHGPSGIDYFMFPKNLSIIMKPFPVGRPGWDNWFIYTARKKKIPVIDATKIITVIHQNHDYNHQPGGKKSLVYGAEAQNNMQYTNNFRSLMNILGANIILTPQGLKQPSLFKKIYAWLMLFYPTQTLFSLKRRLYFYLHKK